MIRSTPENFVRSAENPNGLFEAILNPDFSDRVPDFERRLAIVAADLAIFLTDVAGVDTEMAGVVSARAVQEVLAANTIILEPEQLSAVLSESERLTTL